MGGVHCRLLRRTGVVAATAGVAVFTLGGLALASVTTDQADYSPGSVVTISGANDGTGAPGYVAGNSVDVSASGEFGWTGSCSATVAVDGTWACEVTLSSDPSVSAGSYTYTAASVDGNGNLISESGTFTDSVDTYLSLGLSATSGTYGDTITASGVLSLDNTPATGLGNETVNLTGYSDGTCTTVTTASLGSDTTDNSGAPGHTKGSYSIPWKPNAGTYYVEATFAGTPGFHAARSASCTTVVISKAATDTSITNSPLISLALGNSLSVDYLVESARGISGRYTAGTVAITEETGPASALCPTGGSATLNQAQNDASDSVTGAGFQATGTLSCTPNSTGSYTYRLVYSGDSNYNGSDSSNGDAANDQGLTVTDVNINVCKAAPAVAVAYMQSKGVKPYSKKWNQVVTDVAGQTGVNGLFFAKHVCDTDYASTVITYIQTKYNI